MIGRIIDTRTGICSLLLIIFLLGMPANPVMGLDLKTALNRWATRLVKQAPGSNGNRRISLSLVDDETGKISETSRFAEVKIELAIRRQLIRQRAYTKPESPFQIEIKGEIRHNGQLMRLNLNARHFHTETEQEIQLTDRLRADYSGFTRKRRVLVLDIDSEVIPETLEDRFSNSFRRFLDGQDVYRLEPDRLRPDTSDCFSVSCLSRLGRQLKTEFILDPRINKESELNYRLFARLIDVERSRLVSTLTMKHAGRIAFLEGTLDELAYRLNLQERLLKAAERDLAKNQGYLQITSEPPGSRLYLDGERLERRTNTLVENVEAGDHTLIFRMGGRERSMVFTLQAGKIISLHAILMPFELNTFQVEKNRSAPSRPVFEISYTLPLDPQSLTSDTVYIQANDRKIKGEITVSGNKLRFVPDHALQRGPIYTFIANRDIRNIYGDRTELLYERRFRLSGED